MSDSNVPLDNHIQPEDGENASSPRSSTETSSSSTESESEGGTPPQSNRQLHLGTMRRIFESELRQVAQNVIPPHTFGSMVFVTIVKRSIPPSSGWALSEILPPPTRTPPPSQHTSSRRWPSLVFIAEPTQNGENSLGGSARLISTNDPQSSGSDTTEVFGLQIQNSVVSAIRQLCHEANPPIPTMQAFGNGVRHVLSGCDGYTADGVEVLMLPEEVSDGDGTKGSRRITLTLNQL